MRPSSGPGLAVQTVRRFVRWLLEGRLPEQQAGELAEFLTGGYLAHDTPITLDAIAGFGLTAAEGVPPLVYDLFSTCAFGVCRRPCLATYDHALEGSTPQPVHVGARG